MDAVTIKAETAELALSLFEKVAFPPARAEADVKMNGAKSEEDFSTLKLAIADLKRALFG
jgi:hypothetical protein